MTLPWTSARLAAWTCALLDGVSPDDAVDGATLGALHRVAGLGTALGHADDSPLAPALALARLRTAGASAAWLVWPAPGDVSTVPGPPGARRFLLEAGQGVVVERETGGAPADAVVLVPSRLGSDGVLWTAAAVDPVDARRARTALADAERALRVVVRESAEALAALDVARAPAPDAARRLDDDRPAPLVPPPGMEARARGVLDTARRLLTAVEVARTDDGGAMTATETVQRAALLRDVDRAARAALVAAVNSLAEARVRAR